MHSDVYACVLTVCARVFVHFRLDFCDRACLRVLACARVVSLYVQNVCRGERARLRASVCMRDTQQYI